jgi:4-hydroxybenzoate polyprenyltransferase
MTAFFALLEALRPKQWTKNFLLFFGVVFAQRAGDSELLLKSLEGFLIFCFLSGSIYLFNDRLDVERDRLHPVKKNRPLASGRLPEGLFRVGFVIISLGTLTLSWSLGRNFFFVALSFFLLNLIYTLWLKHQVILDVFGIAINFVLRAVAGVALMAEHLVTGIEVEGAPVDSAFLSPWLLVTTFFGALFLAFAKRRGELQLEDATKHRKVLEFYTKRLLDQLLSLTAGVVLLAYALYTLWPATVNRLGQDIIISNLFVTYGIMRYFYLVYREKLGADPSELLLKDRPLQVGVLFWVLTVIFCLGN